MADIYNRDEVVKKYFHKIMQPFSIQIMYLGSLAVIIDETVNNNNFAILVGSPILYLKIVAGITYSRKRKKSWAIDRRGRGD